MGNCGPGSKNPEKKKLGEDVRTYLKRLTSSKQEFNKGWKGLVDFVKKSANPLEHEVFIDVILQEILDANISDETRFYYLLV